MNKLTHILLTHFKTRTLQGLFWLLPIVATIMIILWLYDKIDMLVSKFFTLIGFAPHNHELLWSIAVLLIFVFIIYIIGYLVQTRLGSFFESLFHKIPGYTFPSLSQDPILPMVVGTL